MNVLRKLALIMLLTWILALFAAVPANGKPAATMSCTFKPKYPIVNLRKGPGTTYDRVGFLRSGESFSVVDQQAGDDGYVWWKNANDAWVRSDLGTSDCPATCGNTVCEYGESKSTCAQDCGSSSAGGTTSTNSSTPVPATTATACVYTSCDACYNAFPCWPNACSQKTCTLNQYGCPTCSTTP